MKNPLVINVDSIEKSAQPFEADLSREAIDEILLGDPPTEYHAAGAVHLRANLTKMGREVLVQGQFSVLVEGPCKRCLKPVTIDEPVELVRTYVPADQRGPDGRRPSEEKRAEEKRNAGKRADDKRSGDDKRGDDKRARRARDDDEGPAASFDVSTVDDDLYTGKEIDLSGAVRESILLAVPPAPVCSDDCKGLCPKCGEDLNQGECGCDRNVPDPRWDALKAIQLEKKES